MNKLWRSLSRLWCDHSGTIAVMTALSLTALVGFAGLGIETTQWYTEKRSIQAASDDAALSAAVAYGQGNTGGYTTEGKSVAGSDGFVDGTNQVSVTVNKPPASGPYASNASAIQVIINAPAKPILSKMFISNFTISGSAVAIPASPSTNGCVLALNGAAAGAGTLSGTTNITLNNCSFDVNSKSGSALVMNGNSSLNASDVYVVGGDSLSNNSTLTVTGNLRLSSGSVADPYANRVMPTPATPCIDPGKLKGNVTLSQGTYCSLVTSAGANVTLNPGVYIIDGGDFSVAGNSTVTGTGVSIVLTSSVSPTNDTGNIIINGGSTVTLTAPDASTNLPTEGMVFWQDGRAADSGKDNFNGGSTMNITGAIYLPSQSVSFNGGNSTGGSACTQIVASIISFSGNSQFNNNCAGLGLSNITPPSALATLAQ